LLKTQKLFNTMNENYYIRATKINARVADLVLEGNHITIDGYTFEKLDRKPRGRVIERRLLNTETQERILIYS
jgi:hypothetical protein